MEKKLEKALEKIRKVLAKRPEVLAAYLYGSHTKGYAREGSDLDIAIMMEPDFSGNTYYYQFDLESDVLEALNCKENEIDTILLDNMGYPLRYNASIGGKLFYSRDDIKRAREEVKIQNEREDFGDFFEQRLKYNLEGARRYLDARS